jgi:hypothetical protein
VKHDESCPRSGRWYVKKECNAFSTDGTGMGALIAHSFGTTDEAEIMRRHASADVAPERDNPLTGMAEEQADWDAD